MPSSSNGKYTLGRKREGVDLTVPSGALCRVKRPDPQALIKAGLLNDFDELTALVSQNIQETEGKQSIKREALTGLAENLDQLQRGLNLMDRVVEFVVIEPKLVWPVRRDEDGQPMKNDKGDYLMLPEQLRSETIVYTDDVELEDKSFILQHALGGSGDLKAFRDQQDEFLADVRDGEVVSMPSIADLAS